MVLHLSATVVHAGTTRSLIVAARTMPNTETRKAVKGVQKSRRSHWDRVTRIRRSHGAGFDARSGQRPVQRDDGESVDEDRSCTRVDLASRSRSST